MLYSSATGASEPNNLAYMTRLGTFGYKSMVRSLSDSNLPGLALRHVLRLFGQAVAWAATWRCMQVVASTSTCGSRTAEFAIFSVL